MTLEIVEVLRRSEQGLTRPFICRASDEKIYFVKGKGASREGQIYEWLAGNLGLKLDLPLAPFKLVALSDEMLGAFSEEWRRDFGRGLAFGSMDRQVNELTFSGIEDVPAELQKEVFLFDLWIRNGDRILFENGGNPNLFWNPSSRELVVIDHNCAFDGVADKNYCFKNHIFRDEGRQLMGDFYSREHYTPRLERALSHWHQIVGDVPQSWFFADDEMTQRIDINLDAIYSSLARFREDEFWAQQ